jgi:hypothetical protein
MNGFTYDRKKAVDYANTWWNDYNPAFQHFVVDCTNYVSQCLDAGGMPMHGAGDRMRGWWYARDNWSYSWSVAHSFYWYFKSESNDGNVEEVETAKALYPGDVICYDFQGDGRYDHTTIVVAKDMNGSPLVNAHTDNSWHRPWVYTDSAAWTPTIHYAFFHIL